MKISSVTQNTNNFFSGRKNKPLNGSNALKMPAFKGIFIEDDVRIGNSALSTTEPKFTRMDALLLNDIASMYPNQDCFIRSDSSNLPRLEYREKPPEVAIFHENYSQFYEYDVSPFDFDYPAVPLIIYPNSEFNEYIGLTSSTSFNPSLPYTIKAGYELHKKIMEKKFQILDALGPVDKVDLGNDTIIEKSQDSIDEAETSLTRYLLECAYTFMTNSTSSKKFYEANSRKIQSTLSVKRRLDLTTPTASQPAQIPSKDRKDICELAMQEYPNTEENKAEIEKIVHTMKHYNMHL